MSISPVGLLRVAWFRTTMIFESSIQATGLLLAKIARNVMWITEPWALYQQPCFMIYEAYGRMFKVLIR